jgi:uncharacterized protein (DUF305 family)
VESLLFEDAQHTHRVDKKGRPLMRTTWAHWSTTAILAFFLTACTGGQQSGAAAPTSGAMPGMQQGETAMTTTPTTAAMPGMDHGAANSDAPYDAQFIDSMVIHHEGAIEMANQALQRAEHAELKTLAEDIIRAQTTEIAQLQTWRSEWYPELAPTQGMGMSMGDMEISTDTGKSFDERFIEAMIGHHEGAIAMAKDAQQKAEKAEIKTLAQNIITAQEEEISQMRQWQTEWFG